LDNAHNGIYRSSHIIGCESSNEGIEFLGGRTDSQEEWHFNEDKNAARDTGDVSLDTYYSSNSLTHMHKMLKMIRTALKEKILAIPTARHRMIHSTPVLIT
jgi:hypothetical protein